MAHARSILSVILILALGATPGAQEPTGRGPGRGTVCVNPCPPCTPGAACRGAVAGGTRATVCPGTQARLRVGRVGQGGPCRLGHAAKQPRRS